MAANGWARSLASLVVLAAALGCFSRYADAGTLVSTTGTSSGLFNNNPEGVSWTITDTYTDVSVSALVSSASSFQEGAGTMYLTNSIGPGTTVANVVAEAALSNVAFEPTADTALFSGLTLGPGTYYLVSSSNLGMGGIAWEGLDGPTTTTAADVAFNGQLFSFDQGSFAPADSFNALLGPNFGVDVTGAPLAAVAPEPGSLALLGSGLLGVVAAGRRRFS